MSTYPREIFKAVVLASIGVGVFFILMSHSGSGRNALIGTISGYTLTVVGTILFTTSMISNIVYAENQQGKKIQFVDVMLTMTPFVLFMCLLIAVIMLLSTYFEYIANGWVSDDYSSLMLTLLPILLAIIYYFRQGTQTDEYLSEHRLSRSLVAGLVLLELLGAFVIAGIYTVLVHYSTDGYENIA